MGAPRSTGSIVDHREAGPGLAVGLLYFLFNRDCPIRQVEVAFYEREELQREVIARIERRIGIFSSSDH